MRVQGNLLLATAEDPELGRTCAIVGWRTGGIDHAWPLLPRLKPAEDAA